MIVWSKVAQWHYMKWSDKSLMVVWSTASKWPEIVCFDTEALVSYPSCIDYRGVESLCGPVQVLGKHHVIRWDPQQRD